LIAYSDEPCLGLNKNSPAHFNVLKEAVSVPTKVFAVSFAVRKYLLAVVQDLRGASVNGFLRTGASFKADVNLVVQVAMGVALIAGAFLSRAKRYTAHGICQTAVLLLNLAMILYVMWPSFYSEVLPVLPKHLTDSYYGVSSAHGVLGVSAELFALYIALVAGKRGDPFLVQLCGIGLSDGMDLALRHRLSH
jgi:uncharacterized membrane protein YozB (DUF420 family)